MYVFGQLFELADLFWSLKKTKMRASYFIDKKWEIPTKVGVYCVSE